MHQPKTSVRLSPYDAISPNARRNITKITRGYKVIVRIGWRVVVSIFALNCMYMQAASAGNASCCKNHSTATAADYQVTVGWNTVAKATENF